MELILSIIDSPLDFRFWVLPQGSAYTALRLTAMSLVRALRPQCPARFLSRSLATHANTNAVADKDCSSINPPYAQLLENLSHVRRQLGNRPLTLAEKILYSHLHRPEEIGSAGIVRGETYLQLRPERVAMQDASAQYVAILFFTYTC
jgi:homoaconitase